MAEETPQIAQETIDIAPDIAETPVKDDTSPDDTPPVVQSTVAETPPATIVQPKRKPGRPRGACNKAPAKPRAKKVVVSEAVEVVPPPSPQPDSRWDAQHQPIPTDAKTEMAELMLRLLSERATERQRRKDAQRRAWFN